MSTSFSLFHSCSSFRERWDYGFVQTPLAKLYLTLGFLVNLVCFDTISLNNTPFPSFIKSACALEVTSFNK